MDYLPARMDHEQTKSEAAIRDQSDDHDAALVVADIRYDGDYR